MVSVYRFTVTGVVVGGAFIVVNNKHTREGDSSGLNQGVCVVYGILIIPKPIHVQTLNYYHYHYYRGNNIIILTDTPAAPQTELIMYFLSSCGMVG